MPHAPFKLLRIAVLGSSVFGLAAGAHLVAGGTLPSPSIMAAILALLLLVTTVATKFRLTLPTMAALLVGSQLVLHQAFASLSRGTHPAAGDLGVGTAMDAMHHHPMSADAQGTALVAQSLADTGLSPDLLGHAGEMSGWMMAAHIVATLLAAALLAYGENALWSLANWLRPLRGPAAVVLQLPAKAVRCVVIPRSLPRPPWRNLRPDTRRGPPARMAVSS